METWEAREESTGADILLRSGTGNIVSVEGINLLPETDNEFERYRIALSIHPDGVHTGSVVHTIMPTIQPKDTELLATAITAASTGQTVNWTVEWRRHDRIPNDIPLAALDFSMDTWSIVRSLELLAPTTA